MGRAAKWGLPMRFARMLDVVPDPIPPARIEVRSSAGSNARHAPTSDQDASAPSRHCFTGLATCRHRHEVHTHQSSEGLDKAVLIEADVREARSSTISA